MVQCADPKQEYRDASFKGVPFKVTTDATSVGRRGDLYEFPHGERVGWRDLGRAAPEIAIEGYLIGDDHHRQAAAMKAAAESPGPGVLVHPIYGELVVACRRLTITHEPEGRRRMTVLSFDFVEVDSFGAGAGGGIPLFLDAIDTFIDQSRDAFTAVWDVMAAPMFRQGEIRDSFISMARVIRDVLHWWGHAEDDTYDAYALLDTAVVGGIGMGAKEVMFTLHRGIEVIYETADSRDAIDGLRVIADAASSPPMTGGAAARNINSMRFFVRRLCAAYTALAANDIQNMSVAEAFEIMRHIDSLLDDDVRDTSLMCDDAMIRAIREMRARVQERMMDIAFNAPAEIKYAYPMDIPGAMPSLVLAHHLYGDSRLASELERLNGWRVHISSPGRLLAMAME